MLSLVKRQGRGWSGASAGGASGSAVGGEGVGGGAVGGEGVGGEAVGGEAVGGEGVGGGSQSGRKTPNLLLCFRCEVSFDQLAYLPNPCLPMSNVMMLSHTFFASESQTVGSTTVV